MNATPPPILKNTGRFSAFALPAGLVIALLLFLLNPFQLEAKPCLVLAVAVLMISWWILEVVPMPVVALLPIILFPLFGIAPLKDVCRSYADSTIFLFMGGFLLAIALEKWNLHKRIALLIIQKTGTNGNRIILGFILSTGFLSLWLSNTATTLMMFPIATSVIHVIEAHHTGEGNLRHFSLALMLSIAYASNFAIGTIIGTPPNVAYAAYMSETLHVTIPFSAWMLLFIPLTALLMLLLYWVLVKVFYVNGIRHSEAGSRFVQSELDKMGKMKTAEKRVLVVFILTVFAWISKDLFNAAQSLIQLDDTMIAMAGGLSLFFIPSSQHQEPFTTRLLEWPDTSRMAWGILLMFGGGIALAKALEDAKLTDQIGSFLTTYSGHSTFLLVLSITAVSIFLSEVMSNVAQVIVMTPIITAMALNLQIDPLLLGIPMTLAASCACMLPMGTPPNALVFASGHIRMRDMLKAGFALNLIAIILITLFCYFLQPLVMNLFK
ncbi:MAG: SLC13 family permease [Ferruginibacter sp.]